MAPSKVLTKATALTVRISCYIKHNFVFLQFWFMKLTSEDASILQSLDRGGFTGAVFLDLSKAFDTVDHVLLVEKLKTIGASSLVVKWFASYLVSMKSHLLKLPVNSTNSFCWSTPRKHPWASSFSDIG